MWEMRKFVAPEFILGRGAIDLAGRYARNLGARRVLLVTDPGVVEAGWADRTRESVEAEDIEVITFDRVVANPRDWQAEEGARLYRSRRCEAIVAVGGGSPMDCAKAIGMLHNNPGMTIRDFTGIDRVPEPGPPLICLPTTAGTAADVSQFAIITDSEERVKRAIVTKLAVPDVALVDPDVTMTMSPYLTACTAMDALVHALEAFVSTAHSPITDLHALEAIRLVSSHLELTLAQPMSLEHRGALVLASLQAGLAFSNASLGAVHAMAHSLGGLLDLPHGECNSLLLPHVVAFNFHEVPERFRRVAEALGCDCRGMSEADIGRRIVERILALERAVGISGGLAARGVQLTDVRALAEKAIIDPCMVTNPRSPVRRDIERVYEEAL